MQYRFGDSKIENLQFVDAVLHLLHLFFRFLPLPPYVSQFRHVLHQHGRLSSNSRPPGSVVNGIVESGQVLRLGRLAVNSFASPQQLKGLQGVG